MMLQHPWKIAWRLPFLPTHLISGHFLIGVHHVVQKWIGIGVNLRMCFRQIWLQQHLCDAVAAPMKNCMEAAISSYPFNKWPFLDRRASCCPEWIGTGVNLRCVSDFLLFRQFDPLLLWFTVPVIPAFKCSTYVTGDVLSPFSDCCNTGQMCTLHITPPICCCDSVHVIPALNALLRPFTICCSHFQTVATQGKCAHCISHHPIVAVIQFL
jgi:hypothetical protein